MKLKSLIMILVTQFLLNACFLNPIIKSLLFPENSNSALNPFLFFIFGNQQTNSSQTTTVPSFTLGGTISGLTQTGLLLSSGTTTDQTVSPTSGSTSFQFTTAIDSGSNYNVTIATQPSGNTCTISNNSGTLAANVSNVAIACETINTLYVLNIQNQTIQAITAKTDGTLTTVGSYPTGTNKSFILWNGKHIIVGGGVTGVDAEVRSYLRNPDGSLTLASTFGLTSGVWLSGTFSVHPNGGSFFFKSGAWDNAAGGEFFSKVQIDTNGIFFGEAIVSSGSWVVPGPIHPSGTYLYVMNKAGQQQLKWTVNPTTGALSGVTGNLPDINNTSQRFYPDGGNCIYSSNESFMYCADSGLLGDSDFNIKQLSVASSGLTPLTPFAVTAETGGGNYQGPKAIILHPTGNYLFAYGSVSLLSYPVDTLSGIVGPGTINTIPAPSSCPNESSFTDLAIHPLGTFLYSICSATGNIGAYPISGSGVLGTPTIFATSSSNSSQRILLIAGN